MDYTLITVYPDGTFGKDDCATLIDVQNYMYHRMQRKFEHGIPHGSVTFHVIDNTKKEN